MTIIQKTVQEIVVRNNYDWLRKKGEPVTREADLLSLICGGR
jgi:hypothetical protein